jgi:hypothetical protein
MFYSEFDQKHLYRQMYFHNNGEHFIIFCEDSSIFCVKWNKEYSVYCWSVVLSGPFCSCTPDVSRVGKGTLARKVIGEVNGFISVLGHGLFSLQALKYWCLSSCILLSQEKWGNECRAVWIMKKPIHFWANVSGCSFTSIPVAPS